VEAIKPRRDRWISDGVKHAYPGIARTVVYIRTIDKITCASIVEQGEGFDE